MRGVTILQSLISRRIVPSPKHWHSRLAMRPSRTPFVLLMASGGMLSSLGSFPMDDLSMALLSSPAVGNASSPSMTDIWAMVSSALSAFPEAQFWVVLYTPLYLFVGVLDNLTAPKFQQCSLACSWINVFLDSFAYPMNVTGVKW